MRRTVNFRLLGWLSAGAIVFFIALFAIHEWQIRRNSRMLLHQADASMENRQWHRAAHYYNQYLSYQPDDTSALINYGRALTKTADSPSARYHAFLVVEQAARRQPNNATLRKDVVRAALAQGRQKDAIYHLKELLKSKPDDGELWRKLGLSQEQTGAYEDAEKSYRKAIAADTKALDSYLRLVNLLHYQLSRSRDVVEVLDEMVQANSNSYQAHLKRAQHLETIGKREAAWKDIAEAYALAPEQPEVILAKSRMEHSQGELAEARLTLTNALKHQPENIEYYKSLALVEMRADQPEQAIAWLRQGLEKKPNSAELQLALTDLLVGHGKVEDARAALDQLHGNKTEPAVIDCLQARLWMKQGKWQAAIAKLEKARQELSDSPLWSAQADYLLGAAHQHLGDTAQALANYQFAIKKSPSWVAARAGLSRVLLDAGRVGEALAELEKIIDNPQASPQVHTLWAEAWLRRTLSQSAEQRNWLKVEKAVDLAAEDNPQAGAVLRLKADLLSAQARFDAARQLLIKALQDKKHRSDILFWTSLARVAREQGKPGDAAKILAQAENELGDSLALRLGWADFWSAGVDRKARSELLQVTQKKPPLAPVDQLRLHRVVAQRLYYLGDVHAAARLWQDIAQANPKDLQSRFLLFDLALQQHKKKVAEDIVKQLRDIEGQDGDLWRYAKAATLVTFAPQPGGEKWQQARKLLQDVKRKRPNWSRAALLEGWLEENIGHRKEAIAKYMLAVQLGDVPPATASRLVRLLFQSQQYLQADLVLRRIEQRQTFDKDTTKIAVELAFLHNNKRKAVLLAEQLVPADARDYRDQLWKAGILERAGLPVQAEQVLRRLTEKSPHVPETWVALVEHLSSHGKVDEARALLEDIAGQAPAPRLLLTLGLCHESLGDTEIAATLLKKYMKSQPHAFMGWRQLADFYLRHNEPAQAEPLLRKLIDPARGVPQELVARARRQLARALAAQDDLKKYYEALRIIEASRFSPEDDAAFGMILATKPARRKEAIQVLESAAAKVTLQPDEQFQLAKLNIVEHHYDKADKQLRGLIQADRRKPEYLPPFIRVLLQQRDATGASLYLQRLQTLNAQHPALAELNSELRILQSQQAANK